MEEQKSTIKLEKEGLRKGFSEERCKIALILLFVALIILFSVFILCFYWFPVKDYLMIFSAGIIGSAFRAKFFGQDIKVDKTINDLQLAYYFKYPIVIFLTSFLILSFFTWQGYQGWVFYSATIPTSFFAGMMGLAIIEKIFDYLLK